jgi:hypothetical protein
MKKLSSLFLAAAILLSSMISSYAQNTGVPKQGVPVNVSTTKKDRTVAPAKDGKTATVTPAVKTKKDGTPDKRYKENKKLKKDGTPDKRYKENKAAEIAK